LAFLVLAYPEIEPSNFELIQVYRRKNDGLFYSIVDPHFTIVFPVFDQTESEFLIEIQHLSKNYYSFDFVLRCSTINKDAFSEYYHAFLVPDEGNSNFIKIHDKLYSEKLKENHRMDLDFIPHIGIGNSKEKMDCKKMVDEWNTNDFAISGTVSCLTVVEFKDNSIRNIAEIPLELNKNSSQYKK
jgi:hypothetical protein